MLHGLRATLSVESRHDAIDGLPELELAHRPFAGLIGKIEPLRHDAIEALLPEPFPCHGFLLGCFAKPEHRGGRLCHEVLELAPPLGEGPIEQRDARARQQIKDDQLRRRFARQLADAAFGRMQAQLQGLEGATGDDELAIEHEVVFGDLLESLGRPRGSSARAASGSSTAGGRGRRADVRGSGSHRTSARTASQVPHGSSSTASASIGGRSSDSGVEAAVIHSPAYLATSPRNPPSRPGAQCAASRPAAAAAVPWPPTTARPATSSTRRPGQDHRHRLRMDRRDLRVRRRGQETEEIGSDRMLDLPR